MRAVGGSVQRRITGTSLDRVAAGQLVKDTRNGFVYVRSCDLALVGDCSVGDGKDRAGCNDSVELVGGAVASINSLLEDVDI